MITIVINQKVGIICFRFLIVKIIMVVIDYRHRDFIFINLLLAIIEKLHYHSKITRVTMKSYP